jgi:flagellar FliL protein
LKANPKTKADPKDDAGGSSGGKKKLLAILGGAMLVMVIGAAAAWFMTAGSSSSAAASAHKAEKAEPPEYIALEPFTVNLQPENGDQYLQVQFTLQLPNAEAAEVIKGNMAKVRSRVLLLLSGKHASEINTVEGKHALAKEIVATVKQPFVDKGPPQQVSDVLFTAFIIQ